MALQVYWLLSAIAQDQPKNKAVGELRDNCERAALEGSWVRQLQNLIHQRRTTKHVLLSVLCKQYADTMLDADHCHWYHTSVLTF